jgi:hypothetical protein
MSCILVESQGGLERNVQQGSLELSLSSSARLEKMCHGLIIEIKMG